MKRDPVLIVMSLLAGYQILVAGGAFAETFGAETAALLILIGAAVQATVQFYVKGQVTPYVNVVEFIPNNDKTRREVHAGPANDMASEGVTVRVKESA